MGAVDPVRTRLLCHYSNYINNNNLPYQSITCLLFCRSVGTGPRWTDSGSADWQWSVWAGTGRAVEEDKSGGEKDQRRVHVGRRTAGGGQSYDVNAVQNAFLSCWLMAEPCTFLSATGSCHTISWFSSTASAASVLPCAWCLSSWRMAVCPTTCEKGKAVCLRTRCWTCV